MKKHHRSRTIFILLGVLVFIFLVIFGLRYFQSDYSFQEVDLGNESQQPFEDIQ